MIFNLVDKAKITIDGVTTIKDLSVKQNTTYTLFLTFPEDIRSYKLKGEIRNKSLDLGGTLLANFSFANIVYDSVTNKTSFLATITAPASSNLPPTKYQGKGELNFKTAYVYDLKLIRPDGVIVNLIDLSFIQVKPTVTDILGEV